MKDKVFFDTNIICYAYDASEPIKRAKCKELVESVFAGTVIGVVSNQVLVETFNAFTRKLGVHIDIAQIIIKSLIVSENWLKINYTYNTVERALINSDALKIPFLDMLIAETMKENGINRIVTEDHSFSRIPWLVTDNPIDNGK